MKAVKDNKILDKTNRFIYTTNLLEMKVLLLPMEIGENHTIMNLKTIIMKTVEGKCIHEGYVKPKSVVIKTYSSGLIKGERVEFTVIFECSTCNPAEGCILFDCLVKSITKAGIHCQVIDDAKNVPVTVFIARDHFVAHRRFNDVQENDHVDVKVIGSRFELNDEFVAVIAALN